MAASIASTTRTRYCRYKKKILLLHLGHLADAFIQSDLHTIIILVIVITNNNTSKEKRVHFFDSPPTQRSGGVAEAPPTSLSSGLIPRPPGQMLEVRAGDDVSDSRAAAGVSAGLSSGLFAPGLRLASL